MASNKRVGSLRGRLKGVEGWEGGESEGENKRGGGGGVGWGGGY
jgi:hypothetical protein